MNSMGSKEPIQAAPLLRVRQNRYEHAGAVNDFRKPGSALPKLPRVRRAWDPDPPLGAPPEHGAVVDWLWDANQDKSLVESSALATEHLHESGPSGLPLRKTPVDQRQQLRDEVEECEEQSRLHALWEARHHELLENESLHRRLATDAEHACWHAEASAQRREDGEQHVWHEYEEFCQLRLAHEEALTAVTLHANHAAKRLSWDAFQVGTQFRPGHESSCSSGQRMHDGSIEAGLPDGTSVNHASRHGDSSTSSGQMRNSTEVAVSAGLAASHGVTSVDEAKECVQWILNELLSGTLVMENITQSGGARQVAVKTDKELEVLHIGVDVLLWDDIQKIVPGVPKGWSLVGDSMLSIELMSSSTCLRAINGMSYERIVNGLRLLLILIRIYQGR